MNNAHEHGGWTISEVERLTGLPRRDIQRCCYSGKGGLGIVKPQDSSWGRRTYSVDEIALLYVVQLERLEGASLPEISNRLRASAQNASDDPAAALLSHIARLEERREAIVGQLVSARALRLALSVRQTPQGLGAFVERCVDDQLHVALCALTSDNCGERDVKPEADSLPFCCERDVRACLDSGWLSRELSPLAPLRAHGSEQVCALLTSIFASAIDTINTRASVSHALAREALTWAFDAPGIALAIDLWLGAGAFDAFVETLR